MLLSQMTSNAHNRRPALGVVGIGVVLVVLALVMSACSDPVESEEYRTLESDLGATSAELESVSDQLETAAAERDDLALQVAELESELAAAAESRMELESSLAASEDSRRGLELELDDLGESTHMARLALEALATDLMFVADDYAMLEESGVPTAIGDDVVQMLDLPGGSWAGYNDGDPMFFWRACIDAIGDEELTAAFDTWWSSPIGSDEEFAAWIEIRLRLIRLLVEHLDGASGMDVSADV